MTSRWQRLRQVPSTQELLVSLGEDATEQAPIEAQVKNAPVDPRPSWIDRGAAAVAGTFFEPSWQANSGISDVHLPGYHSTLPHRVTMFESLTSSEAHEYVFRSVPMAVQVPEGTIRWRSWEPVEGEVEVYRYGNVHQLLARIASATNLLRFHVGTTGELRQLLETLDGIDVEARAWLAV